MLVRYEKARNLRQFNKELKQDGADFHYEFIGWLSYPDGSKTRGYVCTDNKTGSTYGEYVAFIWGCQYE